MIRILHFLLQGSKVGTGVVEGSAENVPLNYEPCEIIMNGCMKIDDVM
jgi:hypothetical protein